MLDKILPFKSIESIFGKDSGEARIFKGLGTDGKLYKIRACFNDEQKAKEIEGVILKFPNIFPQFYGRNGEDLILRWVNGKSLQKKHNDMGICFELGQMCGEVHNANYTKETNIDELVLSKIKRIPSTVLGEEEKTKITEKYMEFKNKTKVQCVLEIWDMHPANFIIDKNKKVYLIDEDAIDYRIKGTGIARAFLKLFGTEQRKYFWEGYVSKHSADYFDKDYERFVTMIECIRAVCFRANARYEEETYKTELKILTENVIQQK